MEPGLPYTYILVVIVEKDDLTNLGRFTANNKLPENPPTAQSRFPTMATATLVLQVVIVGPGVQVLSNGSKISVEQSE